MKRLLTILLLSPALAWGQLISFDAPIADTQQHDINSMYVVKVVQQIHVVARAGIHSDSLETNQKFTYGAGLAHGKTPLVFGVEYSDVGRKIFFGFIKPFNRFSTTFVIVGDVPNVGIGYNF